MKGLVAIALTLTSTICLAEEAPIWTLWLGTVANDPYPQKIAEFKDEPTCRKSMFALNLTGARMVIEQKSGGVAKPEDIPSGGIMSESALYPDCFKGTGNTKATESRQYLKLDS